MKSRVLIAAMAALTGAAIAQSGPARGADLGVSLSGGGRYDDVRMCVATDPGVKGGMALEASLKALFALDDKVSLGVSLPVMRPILFAAAFRMLQFEPGLALVTSRAVSKRVAFVGGPTVGVVFHYGPDYRSKSRGDGRTESFFAMGPKLGGYFALRFERPEKSMDLELGAVGYISPLFGIDDPRDHKGVVMGGMLVGVLWFHKGD